MILQWTDSEWWPEAPLNEAKYLRLDIGWDEEKMKQIYIDLGFEIIKKIEFKNRKGMALYQLTINEELI